MKLVQTVGVRVQTAKGLTDDFNAKEWEIHPSGALTIKTCERYTYAPGEWKRVERMVEDLP